MMERSQYLLLGVALEIKACRVSQSFVILFSVPYSVSSLARLPNFLVYFHSSYPEINDSGKKRGTKKQTF